MGDEMVEKLETLVAALEAGSYNAPEPVVGPALKITDRTDLAKKYLSTTALAIMATKKANSTIVQNKDGTFITAFFGVQVAIEEIDNGIKKMAEIANDLVSKGLIHSVLASISSIDLVRKPGQVPSCAVIFYPLVPAAKLDEINSSYQFSCKEGDDPHPFGSLDIKLKHGEFWAEFRMTVALNMLSAFEGKDINSRLFDEVRNYLKYLPEGTEFLSAEKCGIMDLSVPYELKFFNPRLARVKKVDLDYVRHCEVINDKLEQFNLFLGIRYFDSEGKRLFHYGNE